MKLEDLRILRSRIPAIRQWLAHPDMDTLTLMVVRNGKLTQDVSAPLMVKGGDEWHTAYLRVSHSHGYFEGCPSIALDIDLTTHDAGSHGRYIYHIDRITVRSDELIIEGRSYEGAVVTPIRMQVLDAPDTSTVTHPRPCITACPCVFEGEIPELIIQRSIRQSTLEAWI